MPQSLQEPASSEPKRKSALKNPLPKAVAKAEPATAAGPNLPKAKPKPKAKTKANKEEAPTTKKKSQPKIAKKPAKVEETPKESEAATAANEQVEV